ncbi:hypothetical protein A2U01_0110687, partial [Trifolium medium]|nr:hypothetical protein [Trifolium medium]
MVGKVFVSCASRRQEWCGAPVIKDGAQDCLGLLRVAQIHVAHRACSSRALRRE